MNEQSVKQYVVQEVLDYATGKSHWQIMNTGQQIASDYTTGGTTANTAIGSIIVVAGERLQITRVWMSVEGSTGGGHFDLYNVTSGKVIEAMGYLPSPGETERVGTVDNPVTIFINGTATPITIALTIATPVAANTYWGKISYLVMDDTRPSV